MYLKKVVSFTPCKWPKVAVEVPTWLRCSLKEALGLEDGALLLRKTTLLFSLIAYSMVEGVWS